jgi:hypothetical protein
LVIKIGHMSKLETLQTIIIDYCKTLLAKESFPIINDHKNWWRISFHAWEMNGFKPFYHMNCIKPYLLEVLEEDTQIFQKIRYACVFLPQCPCFILNCVKWRKFCTTQSVFGKHLRNITLILFRFYFLQCWIS